MITLINRVRFKKAIHWQKLTDDYIEEENRCCDMGIITHKNKKSFVRLLFSHKTVMVYDYDLEGATQTFTEKTVSKFLNGTSYVTAQDFINGDIHPAFNMTLDDAGFIELAKYIDKDDHIVMLKYQMYSQGKLSAVVIPPDFLKYKLIVRKCFYIKMLGIYDWGRAYFIAKEVLVDMFKLLPTYLAYRCGLLTIATQDQEDSGIFDSVVSVFDINGQLKASKRKHLVVNAQTLFKVICKQLNVKDLSNFIDSTEKYRVKIIEEKKKNVAKSRKKRKV